MGPLQGFRIVEMAGIGPGPYAAMLLADMGAEVVRIEPAGVRNKLADRDVLNRGRRSVGLNLKHDDGKAALLTLVEQADALIEGFRPGVMERLGIGPEECLARNPKLVFGRMTGWGQEGPLAKAAGHDINYIALSGVLHNFRRRGEAPVPPVNLVGDFGGGATFLVMGVLAALLEAQRSGVGQVVDAAMVDGAASLTALLYGQVAMGLWDFDDPGGNLLDTGAPFYDVYECADGGFLAVGPIEPQFHALFLEGLGLSEDDLPGPRMDHSTWPAAKERIAEVVKTRTRDEWAEVFEGTDACVAPVLTPEEARKHPHMSARETFVEEWGIVQPAPAPRFSRTPGELTTPPDFPGASTDAVLADWGFGADAIAGLRDAGAIV
jgi:alpha-methylacyl-CoA racemase